MNLRDEQKEMYYNQICKKIDWKKHELDEVETKYVGEVIDALSLGCTFYKPRNFAGREMSASDFRKLAENITFEQIASAVDVLKKRTGIQNRLWYILGVLVRNCKNEVKAAIDNSKRFNYPQRVYTQQELERSVTSIEQLKDIDL